MQMVNAFSQYSGANKQISGGLLGGVAPYLVSRLKHMRSKDHWDRAYQCAMRMRAHVDLCTSQKINVALTLSKYCPTEIMASSS